MYLSRELLCVIWMLAVMIFMKNVIKGKRTLQMPNNNWPNIYTDKNATAIF